jgi:hypothetical protein
MKEILNIVSEYEGNGFILLFYAAALILLLYKEKDRAVRIVIGYLPLLILAFFFLPPFYRLYSRAEGADTYYRILWLVPVTITISYTFVRFFAGSLKRMLVVLCLLITLAGGFVYSGATAARAQNRLHLPQYVLDICDAIMNDADGEITMAAMPADLVPFVRQYDTRILMPYGREMLMPAYRGYYQSVYDAMEGSEPVDAVQLVQAEREYGCCYVVLSASKPVKGDLEANGLQLMQTIDGYNIYRDPQGIERADLGG